MGIIEEYKIKIDNTLVTIQVSHNSKEEFPYYAISSFNVDGVGMSSDEAKSKCENATRMEIKMNK